MKVFSQMFLAASAATFFVMLFASSAPSALAATATKSFIFNINGGLDNSTNRQTYTFNVTSVGQIFANVTWLGNASNVTLALEKSGITGTVNQTISNATSFNVSDNVVAENITAGLTWTVSLIDYWAGTNANGTVAVSWNALPPSVTTLDAINITSGSAIMRAIINSNSLNTTYDFVNESMLVNLMTSDGTYIFTTGPYNGSVNVSVNMTKLFAISALQPSTNYTFMARAHNDAGTTNGNLVSFMTLAVTTTTTTASTTTTTSQTTLTTATTPSTSQSSTTTTSQTSSSTTTTTTQAAGGFFGNIFNVIFLVAVGIVILFAVIFLYRRGWHRSNQSFSVPNNPSY